MKIETALQVFIDEVNDEYYSEFTINNPTPEIVLTEADLILLPFLPRELTQRYIKVW